MGGVYKSGGHGNKHARRERRRGLIRLVVLAGLLTVACGSLPAWAVKKITLLALSRDKAIVRIDGERRVLRAGETSPEGVRLVQADTQRAEIEIDGRREVLPLGVVVAPMTASPAAAEVTLYKGPGGFFFANGAINGRTVKFLVDTGANTVALNSATARRLGIDYLKQGRVGVASTAGGMVKMYQVVLPRVSVGQISLSNVAAGVIEGPHPDVPLLGMSFLGKLEMKRDGRRMDLVQKY